MIRRRVKDHPYTQIDNRVLRRKDMTWEAKGLLTYLIGLPEDWQVSMTQLEDQALGGRDKLRRIVKELMHHGYMVRERAKDKCTGHLKGWDYVVDDIPMIEEKPVQDDKSTDRLETRQSVNPSDGKTPPTKKDFTKEKKEANASTEPRKLSPLFKAISSEDSGTQSAPRRKTLTAPKRKGNPWVDFMRNATESWNDHKHRSWIKVGDLTGRELKDLAEFWKYYKKDLEAASSAFSNAVRWAAQKESWADGKVLTLAELLANSKMIQYAQKAIQTVSDRQQAASPGEGGVQVQAGITMAYQGTYNVEILAVDGSVAEVKVVDTGKVHNAYADELGAPL